MRDFLNKFTETNYPGKDDREREQAAAAIAAVEAEQPADYYVPPLPVAIVRAERRPDTARGLRSTAWIIGPPAAYPGFALDPVRASRAEEGLDFPINTIMADNFTAGWMFWHEVGVWVPPFNYGKVFRFDGSHKAYVRFETPPGLTAAAPVVNQAQRGRVTFYNELLAETPGLALPAADR